MFQIDSLFSKIMVGILVLVVLFLIGKFILPATVCALTDIVYTVINSVKRIWDGLFPWTSRMFIFFLGVMILKGLWTYTEKYMLKSN